MPNVLTELARHLPGLPTDVQLVGSKTEEGIQVEVAKPLAPLTWKESDALYYKVVGKTDFDISCIVGGYEGDMRPLLERVRARLPEWQHLPYKEVLDEARRLNLLHPDSVPYQELCSTDQSPEKAAS